MSGDNKYDGNGFEGGPIGGTVVCLLQVVRRRLKVPKINRFIIGTVIIIITIVARCYYRFHYRYYLSGQGTPSIVFEKMQENKDKMERKVT